MFTKMNDLAAKQICNWKYEHPYSVYNYMEYDEAVKKCAAIVNPEKAENFLCFWDKNVLIAYINIYTMEEKIYIGIGLSPDYCGKGLGEYFLKQGIAEAKKRYPKEKIWIKVRSWNKRALRCYQKCGFAIISIHKDLNSEKDFENFVFMCLS